jgi:hypothetical protein
LPDRSVASCRPAHLPGARAALAELLVTAAAELATPLPPLPVPAGRPVTRGRVALGRYRAIVAPHGTCTVAVGFATAVWLGPPGASPPPLPGLIHRDTAAIDARGRAVLSRAVRAYLAVTDPEGFDTVVAAAGGGLLLIPCEDFARRQREVADALAH